MEYFKQNPEVLKAANYTNLNEYIKKHAEVKGY